MLRNTLCSAWLSFLRQQPWLLLLASIALGFPAEHEKMRETRTPYKKPKLKQKRKEKK
jgi:hypothetical protein